VALTWSRRFFHIPEEEKRELEAVQRQAAEQQAEARSLLNDARIIGEKCRQSRRRNHYRLMLDEIFEGGKT